MGGSSKRRRSDKSSPDEPHEDSNLGYSSSGRTLQGLNAPPLHRQNPLNSEAISAQPEIRQAAQPNNLTETDPPPHHSAWLAAWRERQKQESPHQVLPTKSRKKQTPLPYKPPTSTKTFIDLTLSDDDDDMEASASSKPASEMSFVQLPNEEPIMSSKTSSATPCSTTGHDVDMLRQGQMTIAQKGVSYNERPSIDLGQRNGLGARQTAASSPIPFASNNTPRGDFVRPQAVLQTQITRADHSHVPPVLYDIDMTTRPAVSKKARRSALRFNTFLRKPEYTLDEAIYGLANGPNRPASSSFDQPTFNQQIYQKPLEPNPDTRCAHFDPRIHWTWERSPEWYEKKMAEVSTRGNKKSPSRFGQGIASLRRRLEKQKQAPRQEFPDRVLQNPQWLAAAQALKQMAALASKKKAISPILLDEMEFVFVRGQHHSYE
ncbi:hypothetical protein PFICI_06567 [Pestalotiopsis fici W106-1]|uniref:Uncharacterized protein n=1 Tax=Pestalotiopsis fici (strain W106-1 / CGMCC3.15140) TaxID=1229662 RepID=W3X692_PESFW|nr:uncharacterized protein PFICI_06567 [Pestalotiopsis fici W106-1]ETS81565.1 hypothetical protein PFICI_06567 [Pestalotiopsis fici W106-1]